ncbi:hypothetical protein [Confluentibacter sediminis]|uniref:hypothetical protein n=1 Tax=Confluentibacter sediminis TaxID=2219045 RepID=UPI000DAE8529|nr:hypothetical protein [Confluentibacter sediminis]
MKKSVILFLVMVSIISFSNPVLASEKEPHTNNNKEIKAEHAETGDIPADVQIMLDRLEEIKEMDKSALKSAERKQLRAEVREIKSTLRATGNGLYISSGAIIIILLLIIIL